MRGTVGSARRRAIKLSAFFALLLASVSLGIVIAPGAGATNSDELIVRSPAPGFTYRTTAAERARGAIFAGLTTGVPSCPDGWAVRGHSNVCTHGPDAPPAGVDVTRHRSTAELVATTDEGTGAASSSAGSVPCYGDGADGKRVQVVYAHASDVADRFSDLATSIVAWAANIDKTFNDSAAETGGTRHVRYVTDGGCNLVIQRVQLSSTGDDSFANTITELKSVGLQRTDRKYLIWVDANIYCGIAQLYGDDRPELTNANNTTTGYARIDSACWGAIKSSEAHELMHMLGGVQYTAPHTTNGGHCVDEYDRMCYADATGISMQIVCSSTSHERLFDCNHDDYFSTSPPAGSYLATHWNTASSSWLEAVEPPAWSPATSATTTTSPTPSATSTPTPSPTPTSSPSPTTSTVSFGGSLNRKASSKSFSVTVGAGALNASVSFTKTSKLTVSLRASDGTTIGSQTGASPAALANSVAAGSYTLVVSGTGNATFNLTVSYTNP